MVCDEVKWRLHPGYAPDKRSLLIYIQYKKLSCRRETTRRFVSLNILLSHPRSLKVIRNNTVEQNVCKSLLVFHWNYVSCTVSEIFSIKEWHDLELGVGGRLRSLEMAPFDRPYTTFYWSAISSIWYHFWATWCWKILWPLNLGYRSFKLVPFESLGAVSYLPSIVTMAKSLTLYEIFSVKV